MAPEAYPQRSFAVPPDATEVILLRHGASAHAVPGEPFPLVDGCADPALAPEGVEQARAAARRLSGERVDALFVTTLQRTRQTAAPLAEATGLEPRVVGDLRETMLGDWEGGEFRIRFNRGDPLVARIFAEERWDVIPNAEPMEDFAERVKRGLDQVVGETGPGRVAVAVVHGGVIGELCRQATASRAFAFVHSDNCSISRIVAFADGRLLLRSFNDTAHL
jgi:probable phosphoglycerate mutase